MRNKSATRDFYTHIGFEDIGTADFEDYLIMKRDNVEIHFFMFNSLDPATNYGQVYIRTADIEVLYQQMLDSHQVIHPNGSLQAKPWRQKEFSMLDPDNNLLTFGQPL